MNALDRLSIKHDTDKFNSHWYTRHYHHHFRHLRDRKISLLEIGVGGYGDATSGGNSLRMWKEYFRRASVYGIDIVEKIGLEEERIRLFAGSQTDMNFLDRVIAQTGPLDIVIDDGSHVNRDVILTFERLFPALKKNGIYVIEDTQTSYWSCLGFGGDSSDLSNPDTMMNFFKSLTDCLNHQEFVLPSYSPSYLDKHIVSIHFYHNIIFIQKGMNDEVSNIVRGNSIAHWLARQDI